MDDPIRGRKIFLAGHGGMVGAALARRLTCEDCLIVTATHDQLDLRRQKETEDWFAEIRPDVVFLAAARVGGIVANRDRPGEFAYDNIMIEANVLEAARRVGVAKLVFLGSSCIYPRDAKQPITEDALLTGPLEPTNRAYAVAKIAGIELAQSYRRQYGCSFITAQPTNLYGIGDNFDLTTSHVVPALLRKAHEAKLEGCSFFEVWGSGRALREFLYVDDLADALVFLVRHYHSPEIINVGSGAEISIEGLAQLIADTVEFDGDIRFDRSKPDGTPRKVVDTRKLTGLGWVSTTSLRNGLVDVYDWFCRQPMARGMAQVGSGGN